MEDEKQDNLSGYSGLALSLLVDLQVNIDTLW